MRITAKAIISFLIFIQFLGVNLIGQVNVADAESASTSLFI